jgi:hypothetical protein
MARAALWDCYVLYLFLCLVVPVFVFVFVFDAIVISAEFI